jgi:hypothetical protein
MKTVSWRALVGVLLILFGSIALLQALDVISLQGNLATWIFAAIFILAGLIFLYVLLQAPKSNWWAAIPGCTLAGLGVMMALVNIPNFIEEIGVGIFLASIGLSFIIILLIQRTFWWAIIPGGVMISIALLVGLSFIEAFNSPWLMFFGFAATFAAIALYTRQPGEKFHWAWIPALVFVVLGGLMGLNKFELLKFILPAALLVGGGYFIWRSLKAG